MKDGTFREDLYYRLNVLSVSLAPLRHRKTDIPLLVEGFIREFDEKYLKKVTGIDDESLQILHAHDWPGNVRELRNTVERAVLQCEGERISPDCLRTAAPFAAPPPERSDAVVVPVGTPLDQAERALILRTLEAAALNKTRAAKILGVSTKTIHSKLRRYAIDRPQPGA
jgi:transcriptional regulator with PAS, ATPase and Fis domain